MTFCFCDRVSASASPPSLSPSLLRLALGVGGFAGVAALGDLAQAQPQLEQGEGVGIVRPAVPRDALAMVAVARVGHRGGEVGIAVRAADGLRRAAPRAREGA